MRRQRSDGMQIPITGRLPNPLSFREALNILPFNIRLMLMHVWRAERQAKGFYGGTAER